MNQFVVIRQMDSNELERIKTLQKLSAPVLMLNENWPLVGKKITAYDEQTGATLVGEFQLIGNHPAIVCLNPNSPSGKTWSYIKCVKSAKQ